MIKNETVGLRQWPVRFQAPTSSYLEMIVDKVKQKHDEDYRPTEVKSVFPKKRQETLNIHGWGFTDSVFICNSGQLTFTGNR